MSGRRKQKGSNSGKRPRRKVSRSKRVKRKRQRVQQQTSSVVVVPSDSSSNSSVQDCDNQQSSESSAPRTLGLDDADLAECLFSDDEERAAYFDSLRVNCNHTQCQDISDADDSDEVSCPTSGISLQTTGSETVSLSEQPVTPSLSSRHSSLSPLSTSQAADSDKPSTSYEKNISAVSASPSSHSPGVPHVENLDKSENVNAYFPPSVLIETGLSKLRTMLPNPWVPIADQTGIHLLLLSAGRVKSIQRDVFISFLGEVSIHVHCEPLSFEDALLRSIDLPEVKFEEISLDDFCKRARKITQTVMQYKSCIGANHMESKAVWLDIPNTYVDVNPYQEDSYQQTCRSLFCPRLIKIGNRLRCDSCNKVMKSLTSRADSLLSDSVHRSTPNVHLSSKQRLDKLKAQADELKRRAKKIAYLEKKINQMIDQEGVDIDESMHADFSEILSRANMNDVQKMFLEEQVKCSSKSDPRGHRWHPSMIRLALYIRMVSPAAYDALRDSGAIKLPSQRTLFDYSHAFAPQPGVSVGLLNIVKKKVSEMEEPHKKFVALIVDEMYVSKNLVYKQSDGSLIGYIHLNEVEKEMSQLENFLAGKESESRPQLANKMLAFMVKGLTSNLKYLIASYPCNQLTKDMLYSRTWEVVSRLERAGVKALAVVCDGSSVNRAFIGMHTPLTKTVSGVVFDTLNWCSPDRRPLFFISDVAHLIKTIRNCFYNSGEGEKKTRCLTLNGQKIEWKTIIRLYLTYKQCNFRKCFKLNSQNVFPNSYSCMSVKHAVHVLSETVATDIELQNWPGTEETVKFIRRWNKFFDSMNGLHSYEHVRKKNPDLAPYTDVNDPRFEWLESCIKYLEEWKKQVEELNVPQKEKERMQLSYQTIQGIEMSVRGFSGAVKYLIEQGAKFVNGRVFSQDHLENYFSKQRAKGGGSSNPNVDQFLTQAVSMGIQHDLGIRRRKANAEQETTGMQVTDEPLPKKRKITKKTP